MFVEYESHRAAALARKKLVQGSVFLFGQEIGQVKRSDVVLMVENTMIWTQKVGYDGNVRIVLEMSTRHANQIEILQSLPAAGGLGRSNNEKIRCGLNG